MRIKCICCDVFSRLAYKAAAESPHIVDLELVPMLAHNEPAQLRADLQQRINRCVGVRPYDRIVLGYGLCGNAVSGLNSPLPLVLPRMHDCCAMFAGSREAFLGVFGNNLSMRWCSCGYYERSNSLGAMDDGGDYRTSLEYCKLAEEYGEDNAEYVWRTMHPPIETKEAVYIEIDGFEYNGIKDRYAGDIANAGKEFVLAQGDASWFMRLINGPWDSKEFLEISPGQTVLPVYDLAEVVRAGND